MKEGYWREMGDDDVLWEEGSGAWGKVDKMC